MSNNIEGRVTPSGEISCPNCGTKGAECVPGGIEIRCGRCKLEYNVDADLWIARTDYAIVEKFGKMITAFQTFIESREKRLTERLVMA